MMFGGRHPCTQPATAAQAEGIRFIGMRTEQAAGYAACARIRAACRPRFSPPGLAP